MSKQAVCIQKKDLLSVMPELGTDVVQTVVKCTLDFNWSLVDRAICETDTDTLQVIPYIQLIAENEAGEHCTYVYSRGKVGDDRLSGKCSVGLGGHIEQVDIDACQATMTESQVVPLYALIATAAVRELSEEVGLDLSQVIPRLEDNIRTQSQVIYNNTDDVGKVHLGILITIVLGKNPPMMQVDGLELIKGDWVELDDIYESTTQTPLDLEVWSKLAMVNYAVQVNQSLHDSVLQAVEIEANYKVNIDTLKNNLGLVQAV